MLSNVTKFSSVTNGRLQIDFPSPSTHRLGVPTGPGFPGLFYPQGLSLDKVTAGTIHSSSSSLPDQIPFPHNDLIMSIDEVQHTPPTITFEVGSMRPAPQPYLVPSNTELSTFLDVHTDGLTKQPQTPTLSDREAVLSEFEHMVQNATDAQDPVLYQKALRFLQVQDPALYQTIQRNPPQPRSKSAAPLPNDDDDDDMKEGQAPPAPQAPPQTSRVAPAPRTLPRVSTRVKLEELPPILDEKVDLDGYVNLLISSPVDEFESMKSELLRRPAVNPVSAHRVYGTRGGIQAREILAIRSMIELVPDITQEELGEVITELRLNPLGVEKSLYSKIKKYIRQTYTV